jgi:uncharacterized protein (DUF111 family)
VLRAVLGEVREAVRVVKGADTGESFNAQPTTAQVQMITAEPDDSVLRAPASALDWETDTIAVLETNLDDINAELLGAFVEKALATGALDVFYTPIQMKKSRPGVLLTILCPEAEADKFCELILRETTAFGVRRALAERRKLQREFVKVTTAFGEVSVKIGRLGGQLVQVAPEFESCRAAAEQTGAPLKAVYEAAVRAVPGE